VNAWQLYRGLRKTGVYTPTDGWRLLFLRVMAANLAMGCVLFFFAGSLDQWMAKGALHRVESLAGWMVVAVGLYFGTLFLTGFRLNDLRVKGTHLPSGATPL
jgi:putative peptidoglycan lipid II flippase